MMYSEFVSMVKPYYTSRGIEVIGGRDNMYLYIHTGLQSAWNYGNWSFKKIIEKQIPTEVIVGTQKVYRIKPMYDWEKIASLYGTNTSQKYYLGQDYVEIESGGERYLEFEMNIGKITFSYFRSYTWIDLSLLGTTDVAVPFPQSFIPVLMLKVFDVGSPMLSFEGERTPAYAKADSELQKLLDNDGGSDQESITYEND